jgi:hypothetical protein
MSEPTDAKPSPRPPGPAKRSTTLIGLCITVFSQIPWTTGYQVITEYPDSF